MYTDAAWYTGGVGRELAHHCAARGGLRCGHDAYTARPPPERGGGSIRIEGGLLSPEDHGEVARGEGLWMSLDVSHPVLNAFPIQGPLVKPEPHVELFVPRHDLMVVPPSLSRADPIINLNLKTRRTPCFSHRERGISRADRDDANLVTKADVVDRCPLGVDGDSASGGGGGEGGERFVFHDERSIGHFTQKVKGKE